MDLGRPSTLTAVLECLYRFAGTPSGQSKLAREAGLANNTVAAGYVEALSDLMCVATAFAWDADRKRSNRRRPCKEVKRGRTGPLDFAWFPKCFPDGRLTVISASRFETEHVVGVTLEDFLLRRTP